MNTINIFESIKAKQLLSELNWRKRYDNDTSLWEYKIYKPKSRKAIAFIQICKYDNSINIFGLSVTYTNDIQNPIDCETLAEFERTLDNIIK
jgi:hypothetical protein